MLTAKSFDEIRLAASKTEALAHATETLFDSLIWPAGADRTDLERIAHMIGAVAEAAAAAVQTVDRHNADLADATPSTGDWGAA